MTATAPISVKGLNHSFGKGSLRKQILFDISASMQPGEIVILTGPSGSGKTTFLNIAGLLESPSSGVYMLDGEDVSMLNDRRRSRIRNAKVGFIFERIHSDVEQRLPFGVTHERFDRVRAHNLRENQRRLDQDLTCARGKITESSDGGGDNPQRSWRGRCTGGRHVAMIAG